MDPGKNDGHKIGLIGHCLLGTRFSEHHNIGKLLD